MRIKLGYSGKLILIIVVTLVMWSWITPRTEQVLVVVQDPLSKNTYVADPIVEAEIHKRIMSMDADAMPKAMYMVGPLMK